MILKALFGSAIFVFSLWWVGTVLAVRDRCQQMEAATAPVRWTFSALRTADRNLEWVADPLTWLSWSVKSDAVVQSFLIKAFYGDKLTCDVQRRSSYSNWRKNLPNSGYSDPSSTNSERDPDLIVPEGSTEYEYDIRRN